MSGYWMSAAKWFTGYDDVKRGELDRTTVQACRAVLNRLAQRANDAGVAAIYIEDLVRSTGYSRRAIMYAIAQLVRDGWIWQGIKGQGNRSGELKGLERSPSIYALRPMPQDNGSIKPSGEILRPAWTLYARTEGFSARPRDQRQGIKKAVEDAWTLGTVPVDNRVSMCKEGGIYVQRVAPLLLDKPLVKRKRTGHLKAVPSITEYNPPEPDPKPEPDNPKESTG